MPARESDNKNNRGWRKALRKNFGANAKGQSFSGQVLRSTLNAPFLGLLLETENISRAPKALKMSMGALVGSITAFTIGGASFALYNDLYYDGSIANDEGFYSDLLTSPDDPTGYLIIPQGDDQAVMLYRDESGAYQLYEGQAHRNKGDYTFTYVTPDETASRMAFEIAQDFEEDIRYAPHTQPLTLEFERISAPFNDTITDEVVRGADELVYMLDLEGWELEDLYQTWMQAADYLEEHGQAAITAEIAQDNPLNNDNIRLSDILLTGYSMLLAGGFALGGLGANASSRRRFYEEQGTKSKSQSPKLKRG